MDLDFSPQDTAFRAEARAFIAENYPQALRDKQRDEEALSKQDYLSWHKILARKGWSAPSWPKEWGGTGWTPHAEVHLVRGAGAGGHHRHPAVRREHAGPGNLHLRHGRAEGALPARHP